MTNPDRKILVMWVIAVALITKRELANPTGVLPGLPNPAAYFGSAIVYGIAAVLAELVGDLAVILAFGWTLNIAYRSLVPSEAASSGVSKQGG